MEKVVRRSANWYDAVKFTYLIQPNIHDVFDTLKRQRQQYPIRGTANPGRPTAASLCAYVTASRVQGQMIHQDLDIHAETAKKRKESRQRNARKGAPCNLWSLISQHMHAANSHGPSPPVCVIKTISTP
jgi:hypothetical protein